MPPQLCARPEKALGCIQIHMTELDPRSPDSARSFQARFEQFSHTCTGWLHMEGSKARLGTYGRTNCENVTDTKVDMNGMKRQPHNVGAS
eukprot:SAG31_NODE_301_length_18103_cov_13.772551_10_plen_90_part_00